VDLKKIAKIATTIVIVAIPFGLTAIAGYYGYKKYRSVQDKRKLEKESENKLND